MIGKLLNNKYKLIEKIGEGGMADVYKAISVSGGNYVAVKMLKPEFTNDSDFIRRFEAEAQAASSLNHDNIVSIYDVGVDGDVHYIVMEYVNGITLKKYISQKGIIFWSEAVDIALQICSAIKEAHRNGIIHRDIKPHNILYTEEKVAKVTDFGIARAASVATITMTGNTIGSVHYFSPEQARGGYIDEKSDIYSLGITMYEMVTGKVPFEGDSLVCVALKHIQTDPVEPKQIFSSIPVAVNDIIVKAIKKDPRLRYQTADVMLEDLKRASTEPNESFVQFGKLEDLGETKSFVAVNIDKPSSEAGAGMMAGNKKRKKKKTVNTGKNNSLLWITVIVCILIMISGAGITLATILNTGNKGGESFTLDNYKGCEYQLVVAELEEKYKVRTKVNFIYDETVDEGIIISQKPSADKKIKIGGFTEVELFVSHGEEMIRIPQLSLSDYRDAEAKVRDIGLIPVIYDEFNATVSPNMITRTYPVVNKEVKIGSTVILYKSRGAEARLIKVPELVGKSLTEAETELGKRKLKVGNIIPEDGDKKNIIDQEPKAGTEIWEGNFVDIYLKTKDPEKTPDANRTETLVIELDKNEEYGSVVRVKVTVLYPDVTVPLKRVDQEYTKTSFPLSLDITFYNRSGTWVTVELDGKQILHRKYN